MRGQLEVVAPILASLAIARPIKFLPECLKVYLRFN